MSGEIALPRNLDAERSVLGAMILDGEAIPVGLKGLAACDFYSPAHTKIFQAIHDLHKTGSPADLTCLAAHLQEKGEFDEIGGPTYLTTIVRSVATSANIEHHARIVRRKAIAREAMSLSERVLSRFAADGETPEGILVDLIEEGKALQNMLREKKEVPFPDLADEVVQAALDEEKREKAFPVGLPALDEALNGGLHRGELLVIDADTSMGKSSLAAQIALHNAREGRKIIWISYEMSRRQMAGRFLMHLSGIHLLGRSKDYWRQSPFEVQAITAAVDLLHGWKVEVIEDRSLTAAGIEYHLQRLSEEWGPIDLVILDYLQLMPATSCRRIQSRAADTSDNLRAVCELIGPTRFNCGAIVLSQISNEARARREWGSNRKAPRPSTRDQKESGDVSAFSDVLFSILAEVEFGEADRSAAQIFVTKNRHGHRPIVPVFFYRRRLEFREREAVEEKEPLPF